MGKYRPCCSFIELGLGSLSLFLSLACLSVTLCLQQSDTLLFKHFPKSKRKFQLASSSMVYNSHILPCSPAHFLVWSDGRVSHSKIEAAVVIICWCLYTYRHLTFHQAYTSNSVVYAVNHQ